jgi:hypothetical protein
VTLLFTDLAPALQAAVNAYDEARRRSHGPNEPAMSDANKATIAPMIMAAIVSYAPRLIEACAIAAEGQDRTGYEWVRESLWDNILARAGANVRALAEGFDTSPPGS